MGPTHVPTYSRHSTHTETLESRAPARQSVSLVIASTVGDGLKVAFPFLAFRCCGREYTVKSGAFPRFDELLKDNSRAYRSCTGPRSQIHGSGLLCRLLVQVRYASRLGHQEHGPMFEADATRRPWDREKNVKDNQRCR